MINPLLGFTFPPGRRARTAARSARAWGGGAQPRNTAPPPPPVPYDPPRGPSGVSGSARPDPWDDDLNAAAGYARPSRTVRLDQGEELISGHEITEGMAVLAADPERRRYDAPQPIKDREARWCIVERVGYRSDVVLNFIGRYKDGEHRPRNTSRGEWWIACRDAANLPGAGAWDR